MKSLVEKVSYLIEGAYGDEMVSYVIDAFEKLQKSYKGIKLKPATKDIEFYDLDEGFQITQQIVDGLDGCMLIEIENSAYTKDGLFVITIGTFRDNDKAEKAINAFIENGPSDDQEWEYVEF